MTQRRITLLPDHIANKIAAGEVIQRPESVIKELMENSLDAGAKSLLVVVRDGGKKYILVSDDGIGMDEQDAATSFLRHATSKIATYEDLQEIRTYGFRGEALASIAAVAQVAMKTRRREDDTATVVHIDGGGVPRMGREGREPGTSLVVQHLFYNVPARRKFLKSSATEFRHIYDTVLRSTLSHPETAVQFISDDETIFNVKAGSEEQRVVDLLGERQMAALLPVAEETEFFSVHGFIGKPSFGQKSRAHQYLFLNRRFIVNRNINYAVYSAYEHLLIKGTFPFFLLYLEIDPRRVDVNVHPSKLEAKFDDEQAIYRFLSSLVRRALAPADLTPTVRVQQSGIEPGTAGLRFTSPQHGRPDGRSENGGWTFPERGLVDVRTGEIRVTGTGSGVEVANQLLGSIESGFAKTSQAHGAATNELHPELAPSSPLWQLQNKYILSQSREGVMIVDQHVAHERVLYEKAVARFENNIRTTQQVLFPCTVQLTAGDYALITELLPHFELLGFDMKLFGRNTVVIEGVPPDVPSGGEGRIVEEVLALYKEYQQKAPLEVRDNLAKSFSCKSAIKAGQDLTESEMRSLIEQLSATRMPYVCPHGRPVVIKISIEELDRRFGRS